MSRGGLRLFSLGPLLGRLQCWTVTALQASERLLCPHPLLALHEFRVFPSHCQPGGRSSCIDGVEMGPELNTCCSALCASATAQAVQRPPFCEGSHVFSCLLPMDLDPEGLVWCWELVYKNAAIPCFAGCVLDLLSLAAHPACRFRGIQEAIENGSFQQQATAVALLRLTPVVPFRSEQDPPAGCAPPIICLWAVSLTTQPSQEPEVPNVVGSAVAELSCSSPSDTRPCPCSASNYLLGMTPLPLPAFLAGTLAGMSVWSVVYASLGGASRSGIERTQVVAVLSSKCLQHVGPMARPCVVKLALTRTPCLQVSAEVWSRPGGLAIRSGRSCLHTVMHATRTPVPFFL